jgi:hypothetical protein
MIIHHLGLWIFIGEDAPDISNAYSVSLYDWARIKTLDQKALIQVLEIKNIFQGEIL